MRFFCLPALILALLIQSASAEPVPVPAGTTVQAPVWSVGSEWHYSDGYALKVSGASAASATFERLDAPGQWFSREGFIRKDSLTATTTRNAIFKTVPDSASYALVAGKPLTFQREYLSNGKLLIHASSWTVEGRETVTVPAGTFDCWIIVWRTRSLKSDWTGYERWWYSPQTQNYVRLEYKYGTAPAASRVLMRYHLGSGAAPAAIVPDGKRTQLEPETRVAILQPATVRPLPALSSPNANSAPPPVPEPSAPADQPQLLAPPPAPATAKAEPATQSVPDAQDSASKAHESQPSAIPPPAQIVEAPVSREVVQAPSPPPTQVDERPAPKQETVQTPPPALAAVPPLAVLEPGHAQPAARVERSGQPQAQAVTAPKRTASAALEVPEGPPGAWHAQIGSSKDQAAMRKSLRQTLDRHARLAAMPSGIYAKEIPKRGTFYRAWIGAYENQRDAVALCATVRNAGLDCSVFKGNVS